MSKTNPTSEKDFFKKYHPEELFKSYIETVYPGDIHPAQFETAEMAFLAGVHYATKFLTDMVPQLDEDIAGRAIRYFVVAIEQKLLSKVDPASELKH